MAQPKSSERKALPMDIHVGKRLRLRRSLVGMSQEKLAEHVGITFQQLQKYERSTNRITAGRLHQFAQELEVPIQYFYDGYEETARKGRQYGLSDTPQESFASEDHLYSRETIDLLKLYYSIKDAEKRKKLVKAFRHLIETVS
ncbi:MAG TPA: helix-turn-helix transcriptional regulator [Patescibacteria group bacterium]|nr:helix-turn-helix transcriptional regulator [Patescibacteria group bacterium]